MVFDADIQPGTRSIRMQRQDGCWYVHLNARTYIALYDDGRIERWYFPPNEAPRVLEIKGVNDGT